MQSIREKILGKFHTEAHSGRSRNISELTEVTNSHQEIKIPHTHNQEVPRGGNVYIHHPPFRGCGSTLPKKRVMPHNEKLI